MPTFDTPAPVRVVLDLEFGQVRIVASDRSETTVEAYPRDSDDQDDLQAAEQLRIEYADGRLLVNVPEPGGSGGAVLVVMAVPTGSSLHGQGTAADFLGVGELGKCDLSTGLGHIRLDRADSPRLAASLGDITVAYATGSIEVTADRSDVRLGQIEGGATIRAKGEGDATVGRAHGAVRLHAEKGAIRISRAHADVDARTIQGDIDIGEVVRGSVVAATTFGSIRIGVARTSGTRLSLDSATGTVYTSLSLLETGVPADEVVHIQARTVIGDVVVERATTE
ncbi:DUF4097 family beta strand repeat-containing protein [Streptomyces beigongshangae]|uniref:DUF4097 family beta strand repeat-containing protein n=1 Tax=Streptomyces beigongshangae TaxID=2841597 RepID=UPI001C856C8C|nr:DUF4097 family beta strand repeat-containing protein [Streptomyces sp. REN17]